MCLAYRGKTLVSQQEIGSSFNSPLYAGIFTNICSLFPRYKQNARQENAKVYCLLMICFCLI